MVAMAKHVKTSITRWLARRRAWIQAGFLLVWLDPFLLRLHHICGPVFHCYSCPLATYACPIGVLGSFSALHVIPFLAIGTLLVVGAVLGAFICGYVCPFGFLQDLVGRVPTPKVTLPAWSRHFRYVVLIALVLAIPYWFGKDHPLFICTVCPVGALEGAVPNMVTQASAGEPVVWPSAVKLSILAVVVLAMFFTWRPWCTVLCPLGAVYGLCNRASLFFLRYQPESCNACGQCREFCKYGILPEPGMNASGCIRCLECSKCRAISLEAGVAEGRRTPTGTRTGRDRE